MYRILIDGEIIHDPSLNDSKYVVAKPILTQEANLATSLEFTVYPTNAQYNQIHQITSVVNVLENETVIFTGRVIIEERGWHNSKKLHAKVNLRSSMTQ